MDVERTMEFILHMQAKAEERFAKADERSAKAEARMDRAEARMEKFDKRLEATRKIVELGMRLMVKLEKRQRETAEAQRKADRKFERFMEMMSKQRSNGHGSKN